jgi:ribosomal 30S subunit maturation factor RimM
MQSQQRQSRSELTEQQFYQTIDKQLQDSQRRAYYGTDLTGLDVSPESQKLVDNLTKLLLDTLNVVFNKELDEELVAFILYHGEI